MKEVCSKMVLRIHSWTKGNSNEHLCWHSSKHWKRPKHFRERNNLWWIVVFFNMTQKVSANQSTGRAPIHRGKRKHSRANPNLKQWWFFSDNRRIVHVDCVPEGQTLNQVYYKEVLTSLRERVRRRRRPEMWKKGSWVFHQDNAPAHNALSVNAFLTKHKITLLKHPLCSPDLAPWHFFFYFQKSSLP